MIENHCIVNMVDHFPVVVDDHYRFAPAVNLGGFHQVHRMGVADNQEGVLGNGIKGLGGVCKQVAAAFPGDHVHQNLG